MYLAVVLVVVALVYRLCLLEEVANIHQQLVPFGHALRHDRHTRLARLVRPDGRRVVAVHNPERSVLERGLEGGVVDVLLPGQPTEPLPRSITHEAAKVHDDDLVCRLSLPIGLWIERRCHLQLRA